MIIELNSHRSRVHPPDLKSLHRIVEDFKIKSPGYFFSPAFRSGAWDGKVKHISSAGYFATGLFPQLLEYFKAKKIKYTVQDNRQEVGKYKIPESLPGVDSREYQDDAVRAVLNNRVGEWPFQRGISSQATNAGKTIFAAKLYKSFKHARCIFLVNRVHLYKQGLLEIPKLIGEKVGRIGPDKVEPRDFTIAMVKTLENRLGYLSEELLKYDMVIVDECHFAHSKTYQRILQRLHYANIRIGMSGTALRHKDQNKNQSIRAYFGEVLTSISNDDLIQGGFSTPPVCTILLGNSSVRVDGDYKGEETQGIIKSKERNKRIYKRIKHHVEKDRVPILVIGKYHKHVELLYKGIKKRYPELKVDYIHVGVKDRFKILKKFKHGKLDILVSGLLIKEGANLPLIKALVYAAAGDSMITLLQVVGRALRKHETKKKVYIDDFYDTGKYLLRHSKHRVKELKNQKFKVIEKWQKELREKK